LVNLPAKDPVNIKGPDLHPLSTRWDAPQFASVGGAECQGSDDAVPFSDLGIRTVLHIGKRYVERLEEPDNTLFVERGRNACEMPDKVFREQLANATHISFLQERVEFPDHGFALLGHAGCLPLQARGATGDALIARSPRVADAIAAAHANGKKTWGSDISRNRLRAQPCQVRPGFTTFELGPPLQYANGDPRDTQGLDAWFSSFDGPIDYETRELRIEVDDSVAFCHGLYRITGTKTDGEYVNMWPRQTICFRKSQALGRSFIRICRYRFRWTRTNRAAVDLKP
jgi:PhnB protein